MSAVSLPAYALGGYIAAWLNVMIEVNVGHGFVVWTRIVYGSTISTRSMGRKFELARSLESLTRSRLNFADSALKSSPLWNLTPLRSFTSHTIGETSFGNSAASEGTTFKFASRATSASKMCEPTTYSGVYCWLMLSRV